MLKPAVLPPYKLLLYATALRGIAADGHLRETLSFQSGAALYFCYGSPRAPKDLDFIAHRLRTSHARRIAQNVFRSMGVRYQIDDGEDFSVVSFLQDGAEIGQIEITEKPVSEKWLVAGVPVSSPNQLLTDRIRALHTRLAKRNMVRESDLRDVEYLISLGAQATRKDMRAKALQYGRGEEWERSVNRELLNRIPGNTYPGVSSLVARLAP